MTSNSRTIPAALAVIALAGWNGQAPSAQESAVPDPIAQNAAASASTARRTSSWPRVVEGPSGVVTVHMPQVDRWPDFERIEARSVVEVRPADAAEPAIGVVEFTGETDTNLELHMVSVENLNLTSFVFRDAGETQSERLETVVRDTLPLADKKVPLSVFLHYLTETTDDTRIEGLSNTPPPIFYSETPAVLLLTDGEPLLATIEDTRLQYVINTNWDLFRYREREWYLRHESRWLRNKAESLSGEWRYVKKLPKDFDKLPEGENWRDVRTAMPPEKPEKGDEPPMIFVSERPAELIALRGPMRLATISNQGLTYVVNTDSDLFRFDQTYYYLVSGRWFSAERPRGPWSFVERPPDVFRGIPDGHAKAHVLAAVPGTEEAQLAALEARIPRKATVRRDAGANVQAVYNGEPRFEFIPDTGVQRAVNSANDVLLVDGTYYLCASAVWYRSSAPTGPWAVADVIPAAVYSIPPSSPAYHVTHVHVYDSDDDTVQTGYTSGYYGVYVTSGVTYYGSGWYYPPYYYYDPYWGYPIYYPYPYSYGASTWYNPNTGMYGRSASVYGPYGGYGRAASYNPDTGTYARGEAVWDNDEVAGRAVGYNPRTGTGIATNRYANEDGGWGESLIVNDDKWAATRSEWDQDSLRTELETSRGTTGTIERTRDGDTVTGGGSFQRGDRSLDTAMMRDDRGAAVGFETGDGRTGAIGRSAEGDLYAGRDGEVFRRGDDGWQQYDGDSWNPVEVPDDIGARTESRSSEAAAARSERRESGVAAGLSDQQRSELQSRRESRAAGGLTSQQRSELQSRRAPPDRAATRHASRDRWNSGSFDTQRRQQLNRDYRARSAGHQRYQNRQMHRGSRMGGRSMRGGRRR